MIGSIALWEMIKERNKDMRLSDLVKREFVAATVNMDQEECARLMSKYDLSSLPVCDSNGRLVGRIMVDDVIDVIEDEASEDIFRLAGSDDDELIYSSPFKSVRLRLPWLLITLGAGFLTSLLMRKFVGLGEAVVLSAFVPIVMAMGGNTGIQSSTLVVRRLAMGTLDISDLSRMLTKELATGLIMGILCGAGIGIWARFMLGAKAGGSGLDPLALSIVVAVSLCLAMSAAAVFGAFTPMILKLLKVDPAIASGPFVTASNDILALLIYYGIIVTFIVV
jgi:magnesium transporter